MCPAIEINGVDEKDLETIEKVINSTQTGFTLNGTTFNFKMPKKIVFQNRIQLQTVSCLEYIEAPIETITSCRNLSIRELLKLDGVLMDRHITPFGYFDPSNDCIFISINEINNLALRATEFFCDVKFTDASFSLMRGTLTHELTHATFDSKNALIKDKRLSEGLANLIPAKIYSDYDMALQGFKNIFQDIRYNYHYLLMRNGQTGSIIKKLYDNSIDEASCLFSQYVLEPAMRFDCEKGVNMNVGGDITGPFFGFGGNNVNIGVGGTLDPICNVRGIVAAGTIKEIVGFFGPDSWIIANDIQNAPYYDILKPTFRNVIKVPIQVVDIQKEIKRGNTDYYSYIKTWQDYNRGKDKMI